MVAKTLSPKEALPQMTALLQAGKSFRLVVTGCSMLPFLRPETDAVILSPFTLPAKTNEILFYRRKNGDCVLHRVRRIGKDGTILMCGDAQTVLEPIDSSQIIARATQIERHGKRRSCRSVGWRFCVWLWQRLFCFRTPLLKGMLTIRRRTRKKR